MAKKTIIKKNPTVTVEEQKLKRGRKPKNVTNEKTSKTNAKGNAGVKKNESKTQEKKAQARTKQAVEKAKKITKATTTTTKAKAVKKTTQPPKAPSPIVNNDDLMAIIKQQKEQIDELQNKSNDSFDVLRKQVSENQKEIGKSFSLILKAEQQNEQLKERVKVSQTKYRTKYMQLEHERKAWSNTKQELLNVIADLKIELIKYAPDSELFAVADKITSITQKNHVATTKSMKMPKDK